MITKFLLKQYRYALLSKEEERIAEFEQKILADGSTLKDIEAEKSWAQRAYPLIEEALELRDQGYFTESLKFDDLEKRANKIGMPLPAFLRTIVQSTTKVEAKKTIQTNLKPANESVQPNRTKKFLLAEIRQKASWGGNGKAQVKSLLEELTERFPSAVKDAERCIEIGRAIGQAKNEASKLGQAGKAKADVNKLYEKLTEEIGEKNSYLKSQIMDMYKRGKAMRDRAIANKEMELQSSNIINIAPVILDLDMSTSNRTLEYSPIHPNFLPVLPPAKKWTILVDDTGKVFSKEAQNRRNNTRGRLVGVIVPDYCELPDLKAGFHAVDEPFEAVKDVVQTVLQSPCGVLGISVDAIHALDGELWYVGIETLLDMILRLLPVDQKTSVEILVEQREDYTTDFSTLLSTSCSICLNRLSRSNPYRAEQISLTGKFIKKKEHLWNGYADTVAFCWGGSSVSSLLNQANWINSCLLDFEPHKLCRAVDSLLRDASLSSQEWNDLICRPDADKPNSLVKVLLDNQGKEAENNPELWNRYLEHVQKHLYSKAIDMRKLEKQIAWLKSYMPDDATFSPRMRLLWLTTQLAQANHLGQTDMITQYQKEFEDLCTLIYPEDAPLTCLTCLHVAVAYMNDFNFKTAYDVVKGWIGTDEAIPGRLYYGQVLSTIGQLNAFIGHQKEAVEACQAAIDKYKKLTNADEMAGNINQTSSYKVIAMMDSNPVPENMTTEMETYLGRTLEEAADQFAVSNDSGVKYMHHVFLRYLVHVNSPELKPIIDKYLSHKTAWKTEYGHPWEMIAFYRALLQTDTAARKTYLDLAYKQVAQTSDGTLRVIACVILGGLYYHDSSRKEELAELTQKVIDTMPYLGEARVKALKNQLESPVEPLALAKAVLPFNFR